MNIIDFINDHKNNCFWFFLPVIIFNIIFTKYLPEYYLKNINHPIVTIETITRIMTIAFSVMMAINLDNRIGKIGLIIYIAGILIYFCSFIFVIKASAILLQNNLFILLAPYWTTVIWLIGIGLLGNKLFLKIPYHYTAYIVLSIAFAIIHSIHGYICVRKL
ncbi:MAG TPA: hypothetical protein DEQ14_03545 [Treponema sp.]|nr:hypothetical protein [Treponema sp.]